MKAFLINSNFYKNNLTTNERLDILKDEIKQMIKQEHPVEAVVNTLLIDLCQRQNLEEFKNLFLLNREYLFKNYLSIKKEFDFEASFSKIDPLNAGAVIIDYVACQLINNSLENKSIHSLGNRILNDSLIVTLIDLISNKKEDSAIKVLNELKTIKNLKNEDLENHFSETFGF